MRYSSHRWYEPQTGRYASVDPLGISGGGPNLLSYAAGNPARYSDPTGLAIWVSPSLQSYVDCARGVPLIQQAWQWFISNGQWSAQPLASAPVNLQDGQTLPLNRVGGPPNCKKGGRMFPVNPPQSASKQSCESLLEPIVHEVLETWAYCSLGMKGRGEGGYLNAHMFVARGPVGDSPRGLDDDIARIACNSCRCQNILGR